MEIQPSYFFTIMTVLLKTNVLSYIFLKMLLSFGEEIIAYFLRAVFIPILLTINLNTFGSCPSLENF